jgi:hypothetical protein
MKRVFLDATCWVAAAGSPDGGSALILKLARREMVLGWGSLRFTVRV